MIRCAPLPPVISDMTLNRGQIKQLRAEGHRLKLKPVVIIGQKGLSENLHAEIDAALSHHELLKRQGAYFQLLHAFGEVDHA